MKFMDLEEEHRRHRLFWNRKIALRAGAPPRFRYQYDFYNRYRDRILEPVLDVGCGDGEFMEFLIREGRSDVYGIDISDTAVDLTRRRISPLIGRLVEERVKCGDMISLTSYFNTHFFNTVICEGTLHQTSYSGAKLALRQMAEVTAPDALFYISVRSSSIIPERVERVTGERDTYRVLDEDGVVRCYFSREGFLELVGGLYELIELRERELKKKVEGVTYSMWIAVLRNTGSSSSDQAPV